MSYSTDRASGLSISERGFFLIHVPGVQRVGSKVGFISAKQNGLGGFLRSSLLLWLFPLRSFLPLMYHLHMHNGKPRASARELVKI